MHKRKDREANSPSTKLRRGATDWELPFPEGEDKTSQKSNVEYMQNEWSKANPDQEKIRKRMAVTFPGQTQMVNAQLPLPEIKSEFSALFCHKEVTC